MPDFWKGVASTLDLRPAANVISDSIIDNRKYQQELDKSLAEEQRKQKEERDKKILATQEADKKLQALIELSKGGRTKTETLDKYNVDSITDPNKKLEPYKEKKTTFEPYSKEELTKLYSTAGLTASQILDKVSPEIKYSKFVDTLHQRVGIDEQGIAHIVQDYGEQQNPYWKGDYKELPLDPKGKFDPVTGDLKFDKGYYDPEAGWKKDKNGKIILGVPEYKNLTKTGGKNGEVVFSETTDKSFKTYSTTLETLKAAYENAKTGKIPLDINGQPMQVKNEDGELVTIDADNLKKQIDDYTSQYATFIKNVSSKEFNDWNNKQFNDPIIEDGKILKPAGEAPEPRYYWDSLLEAHRKGLLSENDLQSGREYIKATYHFDPYTYYGIE